MGILRNGFRIRRSLSPVMMQEAFAATASSRNLSSLGSRQAVILSDISMNNAILLNSNKISNLVCLEMYSSNFGQINTLKNSSYVEELANTFLVSLAFLSAFRGIEFLKREELISVFVSITNRLFLIQQFFKNFFCKAIPFCLITCLVEKRFKIGNFYFIRNPFKQLLNFLFQSFSYFRRSYLPFFSGLLIYFKHYPFHNFSFLFFSKIQNNYSVK